MLKALGICILKDDDLMVVDQFLTDKYVSRVFKDRSGGLWLMTLKDGIYYLPGL